LRSDWAEKLLEMAEKDKAVSAQSISAFVLESQNQIRAIQAKLQRLLDGYLEQDIEREVYREQKAVLLSEKKSLDEKMARIEQKQNDWLEPMENWINYAQTLEKIASGSNLFTKKVAAKEVFGSNLFWAGREARVCAPSGISFPPQNQWAALRAAHQMVSEKPKSMVLVHAVQDSPCHSTGRRVG